MKHKIKVSKKAFTLLEVILAVAILIVATSMFLSGFLTSFSYSNNTSVFAKLSSRDYSSAINDLGSKASKSSPNDKFSVASGTTLEPMSINASDSTANNIFSSAHSEFGVIVWKKQPGASGDGALTYDTSIDGTSVASVNRYSFCYNTPICSCGKPMRKYMAKDGKTYWFCYDDSKDKNVGCFIDGPGV